MKTHRPFFLTLAALCAVVFTACTDDDKTEDEIRSIEFTASTVALEVGEEKSLTVTFYPENVSDKTLSWNSSNPAVAAVSAQGSVTALSEGSVTITATSTADNSKTATCTVMVTDGNKVETISGNVSGTWAKNSIYLVTDHIYVPEGQTLTIEEGVEVIFDYTGNATNTPIEFMVHGTLVCAGTAEHPILLSVTEAQRTEANAFAGFWGGIVASPTSPAMYLDHVVIEYTGGICKTDSPSVQAGLYTDGGDWTPAITTSNIDGNYIVKNSVLRYSYSDATYFMGGKAILEGNTIYAIGETGCEAINLKAGVSCDASYNLIYGANTNGFKLSSSGQDDDAGRYQATIRVYNNTIVNTGWRRDGVKGGSVFVEKGARVSVFNNLMVNCKFRAMTPKWNDPGPSAGADNRSIIDYNFYASGSQESPYTQDTYNDLLTAYDGYTRTTPVYDPLDPSKTLLDVPANYWHDGRNDTPVVDEHSIVSASPGDPATNPNFVNFPYNANPLNGYVLDATWDFHPTAGSPVLSGAQTTFTGEWTGLFVNNGLTVNGTTYTSTVPAAYFGAFAAH